MRKRVANHTLNLNDLKVDFVASVLQSERERVFDSSEMRSGRPFAFLLGNGDVVRGLELGLYESTLLLLRCLIGCVCSGYRQYESLQATWTLLLPRVPTANRYHKQP